MIALAALSLWIAAPLPHALALPAAPVTLAAPDAPDNEALARAWLEQVGVDPAGKQVPQVLSEGFAHLRLGIFDLHLPAGSAGEWSQAYLDSIDGLLALQELWLRWIPPREDAEGHARAAAWLATLRSWAGKLSKRDLGKAEVGPGGDLLEALEPDEEVRSAAAGLASWFGAGGPLPHEGEPRFVSLVFAPDRVSFVTVLSVIGLLDEPWRHDYWSPDIVTWTHGQWGGIRVLALEFATPEATENYERSISMTQKNKRALAEHVVQLGTRTLLERLGVPSLFAVALANNMTIELFGEVDTRNDGDTSARKVDAVSIFVPGALSDGVLPPANADSRWRKDKGEDWFIPALRKGQKDGAKQARSKWQKKILFSLEGENRDKHTVSAPFFGPGSEAPPPEFLADYTEFLRAYRSGFLHWLRQDGVEGDEEASLRAFGDFLSAIATAAEPDLGAALGAVYPLPLSKEKIDDETLEGRFLDWLSDQR